MLFCSMCFKSQRENSKHAYRHAVCHYLIMSFKSQGEKSKHWRTDSYITNTRVLNPKGKSQNNAQLLCMTIKTQCFKSQGEKSKLHIEPDFGHYCLVSNSNGVNFNKSYLVFKLDRVYVSNSNGVNFNGFRSYGYG